MLSSDCSLLIDGVDVVWFDFIACYVVNGEAC